MPPSTIRFVRFIKTGAVGHIHFAANNGFNPLFTGHIMEILHTKHIPMIGNGQCYHAIGFCLSHKTGNIGSTIQYRILGMYMQVGEGSCYLSYLRFIPLSNNINLGSLL